MRKAVSALLIFAFMLSLFACSRSEIKDISCDDIIKAYEDAGYYVSHGEHKHESESTELCYIKANISEEDDSDYIYFITCFTEEQAKEIAKRDKYNWAIWIYATVVGESRWLKSGTYGKIEYSYYNSELIKPFQDLIK